jgi:hypothetical protein
LVQNLRVTSTNRLDLRPGVTEPVVLMISRREVEQGDLASVLARLKVFLATREDAWLYRGQMTLVVDGYNDDPRELVDMPQVRTLLRNLEAEWPYWAFFFNQVDDSIKLLLSCAWSVRRSHHPHQAGRATGSSPCTRLGGHWQRPPPNAQAGSGA